VQCSFQIVNLNSIRLLFYVRGEVIQIKNKNVKNKLENKKLKIEDIKPLKESTGVFCKRCGTEMDLVNKTRWGLEYKCPSCFAGLSKMGGK